MSGAPQRLRALFSGVPRVRRDQRPIMLLQAFVDDSKTREEVLVLAGYVAPFAEWEKFTEEWHALLNEPPVWPEFKMRRAIRHPERSERFFRVVEKYALAFVVCLVEIGPLRRLCDELGLHDFFRNPYHFGLRAITDATYQELHLLGFKDGDQVEFIFDKRGEQKFMDIAWPYYEATIPEEQRSRIFGKPRFEKSDDVLPLQAAEIIAWNAREHWLKHGNIASDIEMPWKTARAIPGHKVHWNYEGMRPNLVRLRHLLIRLGAMPPPPAYRVKSVSVTFSYEPGPGRS